MSIHRSVLCLSCAVLLTALMAGQALAAKTVNSSVSNAKGNLTTDDIPAADLLLSAGPITYPGVAIKERGVQLNISGGSSPTPQPGDTWAVDSFFDITYRIDLDSPGGPVTVTGLGTGHVVGTGALFDWNGDGVINLADQGARLFDTEMLSLDLSGGPFFEIRESPTKQSLGQTLIINEPNGKFGVGSFFDIFTELSVDGGQTWQPASGALSVGTVPEPASLALVCCGAAGFVGCALRRQRTRRSATSLSSAFKLGN